MYVCMYVCIYIKSIIHKNESLYKQTAASLLDLRTLDGTYSTSWCLPFALPKCNYN